jgi:acyl transferase domain-containing protein
MGRELYQNSQVFRRAIDRCAEAVAPRLDRPLAEVMGLVSDRSECDGQAGLLDLGSGAGPTVSTLVLTLTQGVLNAMLIHTLKRAALQAKWSKGISVKPIRTQQKPSARLER